MSKTGFAKMACMTLAVVCFVALLPWTAAAITVDPCDPAVAGEPSDRGVQPCADLNNTNPKCGQTSSCPHGYIIGDDETIEKTTYADPNTGFQVTITEIATNSDGEVTHISFTANRGICQVIVKDGTSAAGNKIQANIYTYQSKLWDGSLHPPVKGTNPDGSYKYGGISYIAFCYSNDKPVDPVPEFPTIILTAVGLLGLGGFILIRHRRHAQKSA
ncbi:MAG: hypothetical protein FJZ95_05360 [Chloroflexi bacterium]|nr:hypothetical protein [Chloroflexota bacterium]